MLAQIHYIPDSVRAWQDDPRWWLRSPLFSNRQLRVGVHALPDVVGALRAVYDGETCRRMIEDGYWAPLLGLFHGAPFEWAGVMLALGVDLIDGTAVDAPLLSRLRTAGDQWLGARLELGVLAGLQRHGLCPSRPKITRNLKQWDFTVDVDGTAHAIECKTLSAGNDDGNLDHVRQRFESFAVEFGLATPCDATFAVSDELRDLMHRLQVQPFYERIIPELTEELRRALTMTDLAGTPCRAGRFGTVARAAASFEDGLLTWKVTGCGSTLFQRQRRLVNTFADATANFELAPAGMHRTAAVWLGMGYLDCASGMWCISDNLGRSMCEGDISVSVKTDRFGYEAGVALGVFRQFNARDWVHERGTFHVGASRSRDAYRIYDAISAWRYHLETR
jgi:hypothetical protein